MRMVKMRGSHAVNLRAMRCRHDHAGIASVLSARELRLVGGGMREKVHLPQYDSLVVQRRADRNAAALTEGTAAVSEHTMGTLP